MTTALIDLKTVARDDRGLIIALAGELDFYTAGQVGPHLRELAGSGHRNIILDLCGLSFCDSAGIDLLTRFNRHCRAAGTRLLLCDVPPLVAKSMRVLAADRDLKFVFS
ncbi:MULTISPECIES: STAS domain-containing protein [unclassified Streptomyces]|uniref:STAS domain-containing protein n=1 Tax=unclassified Streptomyces TaxID=2593676 RepID=UPI00214C40FB|nr:MULTISPECIES: STAS domain-containing protein [unclassified Streptomyces]MCX5010319.1 STAS domain-containing protein [Streptomyces sp. NBC_00555]MCX5610745.1 STAS domain-containing protein [Streptomyces sp. NBC_00047]UUU38654.1 STAS domain-containing protein [Streptomyces sp. NBC_00162]